MDVTLLTKQSFEPAVSQITAVTPTRIKPVTKKTEAVGVTEEKPKVTGIAAVMSQLFLPILAVAMVFMAFRMMRRLV
jgi:hypothetical protein